MQIVVDNYCILVSQVHHEMVETCHAQVARLIVVDSVQKAHCDQLQERVERTEEQMATAAATLEGTFAEHENLLESQYTSMYTVLAPEKLAEDSLQSPRDSQVIYST